MLCIVSYYRHVVGYGFNGLILIFYLDGFIFPPYRPWIAVSCPIVGFFSLKTVFDSLFKQTVFISDSVAVKGKIH